jgi:molybdenum cofactor synthesis domain-containing protein
MNITAAVITISDSAAAKKREDLSGPAVRAVLEAKGFNVVATSVNKDDQSDIEVGLMEMCHKAQLVITTGGTGIAERDVTPEATRNVADKIVEGIGERMRSEGARKTPMAALSRGICAVRGKSLILNLPGSPTAATESLASVIDILPHALELLSGKTEHRTERDR